MLTYEAMLLRGDKWCVRPAGRCGTHGWAGGIAWEAVFVTAKNATQALEKAAKIRAKRKVA